MTEQPPYGQPARPPQPSRTNGLAVASLVLGLTGFVTGGCTGGGPAHGDHEVTFEVTGSGGAKTARYLSYSVGFGTTQQSDVPLPFSTTASAEDDVHALSLLMQSDDTEGTITCRIKMDGKIVGEEKANSFGSCQVEVDGLGD
ncbi:MmpS family transport accessory protein [Planotetraspora silvatica]|uniref:MmpS family transport accessory protein n=1 Tax=Planotetraspora silvatica TaxID=234614 RepID=UPI00194E28C7|nr:MmpS family transport accessory protein [Planotetraspora silvatica]